MRHTARTLSYKIVDYAFWGLLYYVTCYFLFIVVPWPNVFNLMRGADVVELRKPIIEELTLANIEMRRGSGEVKITYTGMYLFGLVFNDYWVLSYNVKCLCLTNIHRPFEWYFYRESGVDISKPNAWTYLPSNGGRTPSNADFAFYHQRANEIYNEIVVRFKDDIAKAFAEANQK